NRTSADEVLFIHGFRPFLRDGPPKQPFSGRRTCLIHTVSGVNKNRKPPSGGKEDGDGVLLGHERGQEGNRSPKVEDALERGGYPQVASRRSGPSPWERGPTPCHRDLPLPFENMGEGLS